MRKFLKKTVFHYSIVPDQENYLMNDLGIVSYPTHIIINGQGEIVKVIPGDVNEFVDALNKVVM